MKRLTLLLLALLPLTACTPTQLDAWLAWHDRAPDEAQAFLVEWVAEHGPVAAHAAGPCDRWHDLALVSGITEQQWPSINAIMWRESRCQPGAYNPSGASGLLQIMPMWADDCGGTRSQLFDPAFNLRCAVHILAVQGWGAWAL